jgi:hypothetical protein
MQSDNDSGNFEPDLDEGLEAEQLAEEARRQSDRLTVIAIALARHVEWRLVSVDTIAADLGASSRDIPEDELRAHIAELEDRGILRWSTRWDNGEKTYDLDLPSVRFELARLTK